MNIASLRLAAMAAFLISSQTGELHADDWPMLGRDQTRNPVSPEKGAPLWWQFPEDDKPARGIRWSAPLGSRTTSTPVVADGLIWIGTNNFPPDKPKEGRDDASVLKCFREGDGKLLYEYVSPRHPGGMAFDWPHGCLDCSPFVEGDRLWVTTNLGETICLDIEPLKLGKGTPKIVWKLDMPKQLGVHFRSMPMGYGRTCSVAGYQDLIYVITGNSTDIENRKVLAPKAPTLVCLHKDTGKLMWSDNSPGDRIIDGQWTSPIVIDVNGKAQVLAPQGDGWLRSFDARTGKLIWEFDANPKGSTWDYGRGKANYFLAPPVYHEGRIYLTQGQHPEFISGYAHLFCLDPAKKGDVSSELVTDSATNPPATKPNPNSALLWKHGGAASPESVKEFVVDRSTSSCAVHNGLVFSTEIYGYLQCLDAVTGKSQWGFDARVGLYASPLIVDDKVYVCSEDGDVFIFEASRHRRLLNTLFVDESIRGTPIYANDTLYITTESRLFAIAGGENAKGLRGRGGFWPQWRGPDRSNVAVGESLVREWPEEGPPLAWKATGLGDGVASVAVAGGRVFTLGYRDGHEYATALDEVTGKQSWTVPIQKSITERKLMRWLSQRTPTVDGDCVYYVSAHRGRLCCLNVDSGKERWSKDYVEDFGGRPGPWGFCDYPLVSLEELICTPGGKGAAIVTLNKLTGEIFKKIAVPGDPRSTYGAMVPTQILGRERFIHQLETGTIGMSTSTVYWQHPKSGSSSGNVHTALVDGDRVFCSNGWGQGVSLVEIVSPTRRNYEVKELYHEKHRLDSWLGSSVLVDGRVYTCSGLCIDWDTGKLIGKIDRGVGRSKTTMTCAGGLLYHRFGNNVVVVSEPTKEGFARVAEFRFPMTEGESEPTWTYPVVTGGLLYLRHEGTLLAYDLRSARDHSDRGPNTLFVPTPQDVVEKMLKLTAVKKTDTVYDLGCGDGRIVVTAAKKYGCKGVGCDLDPRCVEWSLKLAKEENVLDQVTIERKDLFAVDLSQADVVTLYLGTGMNARLIPQLKKLKPGSRVVSHAFPMPGVKPSQVVRVKSDEDGREHTLYLWTAPIVGE